MRKLNFVFVHQFRTALIDHTRQVSDENVFACNPQFDQKTQTRQCRSASTRSHQLDFIWRFSNNLQGVQNRGAHCNRRAMLIVMKHWNLHAFAKLALHVKAVGRFDVFQVDCAECWLQRGNNVDQLGRIFFIDLNIKHVDTGKFLE